MNPRLRLIFFVALGIVVGIAIGVEVADESYGLAVLALLLASWLAIKRASSAAPDAWLLAVILVGYVVGNRGFAQLQPAKQIPLLPAEAVLLVAVPTLIFRMVMKQSVGVRKDALNFSVLAWIIIGALRLPLDMRTFGATALRDFATIYYACFFFIAQDLGGRVDSARVLKKALTISFVLLMPVVVSILAAPDFLIDHLNFRGIPIIYHKSDLIATSLAAGFFWLWTRWNISSRRMWLAAAAASMLLIGAMESPRAGMFAVGITTVLWLLAGRWRIAAAELGIVASALVISVAAVSFSGRELKTSLPYSVYEHAVSIFDPGGTGTYVNGESGDPGGNNRFRLTWWRSVADETLESHPLIGLGFGSDLSSRFLAEYDLLLDENFAARSPHSILLTVLGRMGLVGLAAWISVSASIAVLVWRLLRSGNPDSMGLASIVTVIGLSACVGVVLEGPMGAVLFWTTLGLASAQARPGAPTGPASPQTHCTSTASGEWQVANDASLGSESATR